MSNPYQPSSPDDPGPREPYPAADAPEADPYRRHDLYGPQEGGWPGQSAEPYGHDRSLYPGAYTGPVGDHPQGVLILVLGILGLVGVGILSPFAWVLGSRALRDIRATGQHPGNEQLIVIGRVLGIVGTVLLAVALVLVLLLLVVLAVAGVSSS